MKSFRTKWFSKSITN